MTKIKITFGLISLLVLQSCLGLRKTNSKVDADYKSVFLIQNDNLTKISNQDERLVITRDEFSLRFYQKVYDSENKKFYSVQLAAFLEKDNLDVLKVGMKKSETSSFSMGTGMAPSESGFYESLVFTNDGHHYMFYKNEEQRRLNLVSDSSDYLLLEFSIDKFSIRETKKEFGVKDANFKEFYVAILIDRNLNGIIDKGELKKLTIQFKD